MEHLPSREALSRLEGDLLRPGGRFKARVLRFRLPSGRGAAVVKDCGCMHPLVRRLVGIPSQRREVAVYRRLAGLPGIPALLGVVDPCAFAVEFVEGETLHRGLEGTRLRKALAELRTVVAAIHARGVVHLDLKQKRNVIVRPDGSVAVVDFQSALCFGGNLPGRWLFHLLCKRDRAGFIKFAGKYCPDILTREERRIYRRERFLSRLWPFTALSRGFRRLFGEE